MDGNRFAYDIFGKSGVETDFGSDSNDNWMGRFDMLFSAGLVYLCVMDIEKFNRS